MHFMNPVPVMKLVEVIKALATSQETFDSTWELCQKVWQDSRRSQRFSGIYRQSNPAADDQ